MYKRGNGCFAGGKADVFSLDKRDACDYNKKAVSGCSAAGSALGSGPRGREFKSPHSDHKEGRGGETCLGCWRAEMPGDLEHLGSGERSAWRGGLDIGALLQGSWYRVYI